MKSALRSAALALFFGLFFGSTASVADDLPTIVLVMKDGLLLPDTLNVPAHTRFRLEVRNEGQGAAEFESLELRKELVLAPGISRKLVFHPMKPGTYLFFDEFHPETARGRIVAR